jgi:hypothetical protein
MPETQRNKDGLRVNKIEALPEQRRANNANYVADHAKNFVAAMQANDPALLNCGIETGAVAAINAHMGNVAYKTGRKVYWDAAAGLFKDDPEANRLTQAQYQNGWKLPSF